MKKSQIFLVSLCILAISAIAICALYFGSGTVYAKADIANLTVGLKTEIKETALEATQENTKKINNIIQVIKDLAIEEKDIKT